MKRYPNMDFAEAVHADGVQAQSMLDNGSRCRLYDTVVSVPAVRRHGGRSVQSRTAVCNGAFHPLSPMSLTSKTPRKTILPYHPPSSSPAYRRTPKHPQNSVARHQENVVLSASLNGP